MGFGGCEIRFLAREAICKVTIGESMTPSCCPGIQCVELDSYLWSELY